MESVLKIKKVGSATQRKQVEQNGRSPRIQLWIFARWAQAMTQLKASGLKKQKGQTRRISLFVLQFWW